KFAMAETIQHQLQQLVLLPETSKKKPDSSLAVESWQGGGLDLLAAHDEDIIEQLGPIIQSSYRSDNGNLFKKQIDLFIAKKDAEIMKLCGDHHQQFVEALGQLLDVKQNSFDLQDKLVELNTDMQFSGKSLMDSKKELLELKKKHRNIELAIETVKTCNQVTLLLAEFDSLVKRKSYYEAVKTLEEAKKEYKKKLSKFDFNHKMGKFFSYPLMVVKSSFPIMAIELKVAANSDMREWLFGLKASIREIGHYLSTKMSLRQQNWEKRIRTSKGLKYVSPAVQFVLDEQTEDDEMLKIDLKPLYLCFFVHKELGYQEEFIRGYGNDRRAQISLIMSANSDYFSKDLSSFENLLDDIIGFFIIENMVILSAPEFRSKADVDTLWDFVVETLSSIFGRNIQQILQKGAVSSQIKSMLVSFIFVMEEHSFDVQKLRDLVSAIFG
ncbi:hypothetical protein BB560_002795, partial [Smittium megazygosporum]